MNSLVSLMLILALVFSAPARARSLKAEDAEELMRRGGCTLCHRWDRPWIGPPLEDISKRYRSAQAPEREALLLRLRRGVVGNHTPIPMGPCDPSRLSDDELRFVIDQIIGPIPSQPTRQP